MKNKHFLLLGLGFALTALGASNNDLMLQKEDSINLNVEAVDYFLAVAKDIQKTMATTPQKLILNLNMDNQIKHGEIEELMKMTIYNIKFLLKEYSGKATTRTALLEWAKKFWNMWNKATGIGNKRSTIRGMEKWSANPIMQELEILHYVWQNAPRIN